MQFLRPMVAALEPNMATNCSEVIVRLLSYATRATISNLVICSILSGVILVAVRIF
jgi:hypothetical protein